MNMFITGSNGFVGTNPKFRFKEIKEGKDNTRKIKNNDIYEFNKNTDLVLLEEYCKNTDFVSHLAGVNRSKKNEGFERNFTSVLLATLKKYKNPSYFLSSSKQATLKGRFKNSEYEFSKLNGQELLFNYSKESGNKVLVYRLPNLFGKWCKPNYNSVIAAWCYNIAHDLPIVIIDENK